MQSPIKVCNTVQLTRSTLTTLAPKSARIIPQNGAGAKPAISITFSPLKAIVCKNIISRVFTVCEQIIHNTNSCCCICCYHCDLLWLNDMKKSQGKYTFQETISCQYFYHSMLVRFRHHRQLAIGITLHNLHYCIYQSIKQTILSCAQKLTRELANLVCCTKE